MMRLVDLELHLHHTTKPDMPAEGAYLVSLDGDKTKAIWVPKAPVEVYSRKGDVIECTMPEAMAIEKGLA